MKKKLLVVQSSEADNAEVIDRLCEEMSEHYFVYVLRPLSGSRDDSPAGVRFLNHSLDRLPGFGDLETAVSLGDAKVYQKLMVTYPETSHLLWLQEDATDLPKTLTSRHRKLSVLPSPAEASNYPQLDRAV